MVNNKDEFLGIDKNSGFALRVLVLSFPAGVMFLILASFGLLSLSLSLFSYVSVLFFNAVFLMPMSLEIQKIKKYIQRLSEGAEEEKLLQDMSEKETRDLTEAINSMHRFWGERITMLHNRTLSDAAVLDTLPEPLLMVNKEGVIIGANRAIRELFGLNLSGKHISEIIEDSVFNAQLMKILLRESQREDVRLTLNSLKKKPKFFINITTLPWFAKGEVVAVVSFYDLRKMLKFEQMQQDFVANASHELRTPLSIISGFIETLQTSAKDDEKAREKFLNVISEQTSYMSSLIDDLLALSKIEMSSDLPGQDKISVNMLIKELSKALSLKIKDSHLRIETKFARLPQIAGDEHQIKQVLQNLLGNAIKYSLPDSVIQIKTQKVSEIVDNRYYEVSKGNAVEITISNYGVVIPPEDIHRLTERFYRLQEHKNRNIKGTGLGLSIASEIIKKHKGNMVITSDNGLTTFKVFLPVRQESV